MFAWRRNGCRVASGDGANELGIKPRVWSVWIWVHQSRSIAPAPRQIIEHVDVGGEGEARDRRERGPAEHRTGTRGAPDWLPRHQTTGARDRTVHEPSCCRCGLDRMRGEKLWIGRSTLCKIPPTLCFRHDELARSPGPAQPAPHPFVERAVGSDRSRLPQTFESLSIRFRRSGAPAERASRICSSANPHPGGRHRAKPSPLVLVTESGRASPVSAPPVVWQNWNPSGNEPEMKSGVYWACWIRDTLGSSTP